MIINKQNLLISVILITFNGYTRGFLDQAIDSVLSQTYKNFELIIVDDGSIDETKNYCAKYINGSSVRYIYQTNKGPGAARNNGIKNSKGGYICFIDDDDVWLQEKLQKQVNFFKNNQNKNIMILFTNLELIDAFGKIVGTINYQNDNDIYKKLFFGNIAGAPSSVMIRKDVFDKVGFFKEDLKAAEDYDLWIRITRYFNRYVLDENLVKHRVHKKNTSLKIIFRYSLIALLFAIEQDNRINRDTVLNNFYKNFASNYYFDNNFNEFRKNLKIACVYGQISINLKLKYYLSFFPYLIKLLRLFKK